MAFDPTDVLEQLERARHGGVLPNTTLELDWSTLPADQVDTSPIGMVLAGLDKHLSLRATIRALERATADDRVTGLVARVQCDGAPMAVVQELRAAIRRFREAGKHTVAYAESFTSNSAYHLASAFEKIVMLEAGTLWVTGLRAQATFLGAALPNAGLEPQFLQRHEYKNAANQFTETDFTPAHREAVSRLLDSTLEQRISDVAVDRDLDPAAVADAFASGPFDPAEAVERGLIDGIGFRDEVWDDAKGDGHLQYLSRYAHHTRLKKRDSKGRKKIAVVSVHGAIADGKSGFKPGLPPGRGTGSDTVVAGIRAAVEDDDVAAVILRVDSPGGSAVASEVIHRAVEVGRQAGTPFVASMGNVAASGGYYVSCGCDRIVASPGTITGSIGVVMGKLITDDLRQKVKLSTKTIDTSPNAGILSSLEPWDGDQLDKMNQDIDRIYDLFVSRVAEGRGLDVAEVHEVAKGRVWTGADAAERGLVDTLGGLDAAISEARKLAGLAIDEPVRLVDYPTSSPLDFLQKHENSEPAAAQLAAWTATVLWQAVAQLERAAQPTGAQARWYGDWTLD